MSALSQIKAKITGFDLQRINVVSLLGVSRYKMQVIVIAAVVFFIVTNLLITSVSLRLDLSKGRAYTLTNSTKKLVKSLKKDAKITFYVSSEIPSQLQSTRREVTDLLTEYDRLSGKVSFQTKDPQKDETANKEATDAQLPQIPFRVYAQNKIEATQGYFGIVISYDSKKEIIAQATDIGGLEYNITSALYKLSRKELPQVAWVAGENQFMQQDPSQNFKTIAGQQLSFVSPYIPGETDPQAQDSGVQTAQTSKLKLEDIYKTAIILAPPGASYSKEEIQEIRDYIKKGGNAIFLLSGVDASEQQMQGADGTHALFGLLREYGIELNKNLVLSASSELINYGAGQFSMFIPYAHWIKTSIFETKGSYFSNVSQLTYLWGSSLDVKTANGYKAEPLVKTTAQSWAQKGTYVLDPQKIPEPTQKDLKQFIMAAESKKQGEGSVLVISSGKFLEDRYLSQNSSNIEFVLNVLNEYASGGALSGISQREVNLYPIPELKETGRQIFRYGNIIGLPLLFVMYGAFRLINRAKKRDAI